MKMKDLEKELMPRERLVEYGVEALKDHELIALLLGSGNKDESVLELSKRLIDDYGFGELFLMDYIALKNIKGIKLAKASKLMAVFEIARRAMAIEGNRRRVSTSKDAAAFLMPRLSLLNYEKVVVMYLNCQCRVIAVKEFTNKEGAEVLFPIKEIVGDAIHYKATGVIVAHNHPSGDARPSEADKISTMSIDSALTSIEIELIDHLILANKEYYSFEDDKLHKLKN